MKQSHLAVPRRHVKQVYSTECGIACVAMITGFALSSARKIVTFDEGERSRRTSATQLRDALARHSWKMGREVFCDSWERLQRNAPLAILKVNYKQMDGKSPKWHWVVYDLDIPEAPILDPHSKGRRKIHSQTRLHSYFHICNVGK